MQNAAIYARVSTEWQAEHGYSIGTQLEACRKKAQEIGAVVVKEYVDDGYSGGFLERPALDSLRDAVHDGLFNMVIFHDADRMARKLIHQLILTEELEKAECKPVFVLGDVQDTPEGNMTYQMKGVFAEYERAKIRERTMRGKRAKLRAGKAVCDSHIYGYDFDRETSTYKVNPGEAAVVRRVYDMYVNQRIGGCEVIAEILNRDKVPTPTGSGLWGPSTVRNMLHRPHYTGRYFANTKYHKKTGPKSYKRIPRPREEWIEMTCPQIIEPELHEKALAIKDTNRTYQTWSRNKYVALLQGIGYCPQCKERLRVTTCYRKSGRKQYYECRSMKDKSVDKCGARMTSIAIIDDLFWSAITDICKDEKSLEAYIGSKGQKVRPQSPADNMKRINKRLGKVKAEKAAVMSWFSDSLISQAEATEKLKALKAEETKLLAELQSAGDALEQEPDRLALSDIVEAVASCPETATARRRVVLAIVDRVEMIRKDNNYGTNYSIDMSITFK